MCTTIATCVASQSFFETSIWKTSNIPPKYLKHTLSTQHLPSQKNGGSSACGVYRRQWPWAHFAWLAIAATDYVWCGVKSMHAPTPEWSWRTHVHRPTTTDRPFTSDRLRGVTTVQRTWEVRVVQRWEASSLLAEQQQGGGRSNARALIGGRRPDRSNGNEWIEMSG
jgi:hypothetical protein